MEGGRHPLATATGRLGTLSYREQNRADNARLHFLHLIVRGPRPRPAKIPIRLTHTHRAHTRAARRRQTREDSNTRAQLSRDRGGGGGLRGDSSGEAEWLWRSGCATSLAAKVSRGRRRRRPEELEVVGRLE